MKTPDPFRTRRGAWRLNASRAAIVDGKLASRERAVRS